MSKNGDKRREERLLDPFLSLSLPSPAQSLCFVGSHGGSKFGELHLHSSSDEQTQNDDDSSSSSSSTSSHEELTFRCRGLQNRADAPSPARDFCRRQDLLTNRKVVSCHANGEAILWDCGRQTRISTITRNNKDGSGLAVKRIDSEDENFMFQTRDPQGTVSIHSLENPSCVIREYETHSATFCQAAPCRGNSHLLALPSQESTATVMDDRDPVPIYVTTNDRRHRQHNYGMVTSLAMSMTRVGGRPILACGMENGSVVFYDFSSGRTSSSSSSSVIDDNKGECALSKDPVLALDLAPSQSSALPSVVAVAGLAGDALEVAELPKTEQGRLVLIQASTTLDSASSFSSSAAAATATAGKHDHYASCWNIRQRARLSTCRVSDNEAVVGGKPGVAICRFRPDDGRVVAVGGWDHRVRLFEQRRARSNSSGQGYCCRPVGILRGHTGSVNALDWAPDASRSGLLATACGEDGRISFWECYPKKV